MTYISSATKFIGYAPEVNLQEKKSGINNSLSEPYTMQDIADSVGAGPTMTNIPFEFYPPAGLTNAGAKFIYTDGVELISYHIKGIQSLNGNGDDFNFYLCSINIPENEGIFPGNVTGSFQLYVEGSIINTPLANGGVVGIENVPTQISNLNVNLYNYGNNPQEDGSYNYALVVTATTDTGSLTGLMSYDYEFLLPSFVQPPTIFQD